MAAEQPKKPFEPWDGEYIGNIWGWKFSFISLGIILFMVILMWYRHSQLPDTPVFPTEEREIAPADSNGIIID